MYDSLLYKMDSATYRAATAFAWIDYVKKGKKLRTFFEENDMSHIAVYGYSKLGKRFIEEMHTEGMTVDYVIDRRGDSIISSMCVFNPDMDLPKCDVVVVTVSGYNEIRELLDKKGIKHVVSLKELLCM